MPPRGPNPEERRLADAAKRPLAVMLVVLGLLGAAGAFAAHRALRNRSMQKPDGTWEDIYYSWVEGRRILQGVNPYGFILQGDMRENRGFYATYLPGFYLLSALSQRLGLRDFGSWLSFWRGVFLLFDAALGVFLFYVFGRRGRWALGLFALGFWLFNRWTLRVVAISHLDFPPLFLLVVSVWLFRRRPYLACVLFGVSLALKQVGAFAVPLFLVWAWQRSPEERWRRTLWSALAVVAVPLAVSLPFLVWNAEGFVKSVLFSVTRNAGDHFRAPSIDAMLRDHGVAVEGLAARAPLLLLMFLIYLAAARRGLGRFTAVLLVTATFLNFNPVLFRQYMCWMVPFVPLCALDFEERGGAGNSFAPLSLEGRGSG